MKKLVFLSLAFLALLTTAIYAANEVDNPSFNEGLAAPNEWAPADWNVGAGGNAGIGRIFDDSADAGTNCLQLYTNDEADGTYVETITVPASRIYVDTHTSVFWNFSFKLAASGGGGPQDAPFVACRCWDSSDTFLGQDYVFPSGTANVWHDSPERLYSLPANTEYIDLYAGMGRDSWNKYLGVLRVDAFNVDFVPEPTLIFSGLLLALAFLRRK